MLERKMTHKQNRVLQEKNSNPAREELFAFPISNGEKVNPWKKHPEGLTLIELLLATSLFVVLGTILYSILSQGIGLWKRSEKALDPSREERIILGKMAADIRGALIHQWVRFLGEADQIYFCGLRPFKEDPSGIPRLTKIHYYVQEKDEGSKKRGLYLSQYPVEQAFSDPPPPGRLISNLFENFHFEYGYWDPIEERIITQEQWNDPEKIPKVVILKGKNQEEFSKTIVLPMGELIEFKEKEEEEETAVPKFGREHEESLL
jgi:hypothetical protein